MSWIESHEDIADHWKTDCFRTELGISVPEAVGHLHLLWHFTLRVAWRDGDLVKYTDQAIASGARWGGDASAFISALRKAHFLDGKAIHNWRDFCGELINKRISNENRRSERFRKDAGTMPEHYRNNAGTLPVKVTPTVPTLPYPTEPKDKDIPDVANGATSPPLAGDVAESKPNKTENVQNVHLLVDIWNRKAHPNLPRVTRWTKTRQDHARARLAKNPEPLFWEDVLARINRSPLLTGQTGSWKATFDWILNPSNLVKILEGNYEPNRNQRS